MCASVIIKKLKRFARRLLPKNRFARGVSLLAGGAMAGQAIIIAASPILTRLYSPEDFGVLAVFASLLGIISAIASLRYQLAIPLPNNEKDAANVTVLSLVIVLGMSLLTSIIVIPLSRPISDMLNAPLLDDFIWLLPAGVMLAGVYEVLNYWAIRKKAFSSIAQTKLNQSVGMVGVQVGGYSLGPLALVLGRVVGQTIGILKLAKIIASNRGEFRKVSISGVRVSLKKYRSFPLVSTWSALASAGASQLPALLIAVIVGPAAAGLYALTSRVMLLPVGVISKSMGDVFYSEAIDAKAQGKLGPLVVNIYSKMVFVGLPIALTLIFAAPEVFSVIFGDNWARSGELASWMTIGVFFQFVTTPPGRVFLILDRHGYALFFQLSFLLTTAISIVLGGLWFKDLMLIMAILAVGRSLIYCLRFWKILNLVGESFDKLWRPLVKNLPYAILCCLPIVFANYISNVFGSETCVKLGLFGLSVVMAIVPSIKIYTKRGG